MEKRNLRVSKWIGTTPAVGFCTYCAATFKVPLDSLKRTTDAQESLRKQFGAHKCKPLNGPESTPGFNPEFHPESNKE